MPIAAPKPRAKTMNKAPYAVDSSVILAILRREVGHDKALELISHGQISAVNYSELLAKLTDLGTPVEVAIKALESLLLDIVPFDTASAEAAANIRPATRAYGISFADRACLALAKMRELTALTGDRVWQNLAADLKIQVQMFR